MSNATAGYFVSDDIVNAVKAAVGENQHTKADGDVDAVIIEVATKQLQSTDRALRNLGFRVTCLPIGTEKKSNFESRILRRAGGEEVVKFLVVQDTKLVKKSAHRRNLDGLDLFLGAVRPEIKDTTGAR